ncbi:protein of unknown function [Methylocaldum szegediense]|uniref:Uncharacterized protein n=1 Tax=Methylocaldum szegediense TaxID=73780 RepID=A0ABN8XAF2_9GAMM|nr:protein of unknown function [Methylocaldum szegediense]
MAQLLDDAGTPLSACRAALVLIAENGSAASQRSFDGGSGQALRRGLGADGLMAWAPHRPGCGRA